MHDANGTELKVGDKVLIPAVVESVSPEPGFCNITARTTLGRRPDGHTDAITMNTAQVVKVSGPDNTLGV
jgi:hypothetical protein